LLASQHAVRSLANLGYIQVVRHCNHFCGFCSNPTTPYVHTVASMKVLVDDLVDRGYFGVILTGGEPTLHPDLPEIASYARSRGLHVRMITNGWRLAEPGFAQTMADAGLQLVHVSVYSVRPDVEERLRGTADTLPRAVAAVANAHRFGIEVNINCVINKLNADHLDANVRYWTEEHPYVRHFIWNNLDPSMGRAEVNQAQFTPRLADFEVSLFRAMQLLDAGGRTFRVEKVPLCYMTDFAWASTETRKIVKGEERVVHFLDEKQTVRQTDWEHIYAPSCEACTLRSICGGLFDRGGGYDPAELSPVFVSRDAIVERILNDPLDPSGGRQSLETWRGRFDARRLAAPDALATERAAPNAPTVGFVTAESLKKFASKRRAEGRRAATTNVEMERVPAELPLPTAPETPGPRDPLKV
jgi:MoaA/NifB/PqqE/SkfB family radical SAM enzyme